MGRRKDHSLEIKESNIAYQTWFIIQKNCPIIEHFTHFLLQNMERKCIIGSQKIHSNIPKKSRYSERTLRILLRKIKRNPFASSSDLKRDLEPNGIFYSAGHIRQILREEYSLNGIRAAKKPLLTSHMRRNRLEFTKKYRAFSLQDWSKFLCSDETMIRQFHNRVIVRRPPHTRYLQRYVLKTVKHPISIMIWGCISRYEHRQLKIYERG